MDGSGSGSGDFTLSPTSELRPLDSYMTVSHEEVGQLYAYRLNRSAVILGTRDSRTFGAAIGIGAMADVSYRCLASNANVNRSVELSITASSETHKYRDCTL